MEIRTTWIYHLKNQPEEKYFVQIEEWFWEDDLHQPFTNYSDGFHKKKNEAVIENLQCNTAVYAPNVFSKAVQAAGMH